MAHAPNVKTGLDLLHVGSWSSIPWTGQCTKNNILTIKSSYIIIWKTAILELQRRASYPKILPIKSIEGRIKQYQISKKSNKMSVMGTYWN